MQTSIAPQYLRTPAGKEADAILRKCVHCGFCNATCPTYQLLGDELDGPRGRIYLMKQVFEGEKPGPEITLHLDRCLTCRNCETTCPSGVEYSRLLELGRDVISVQAERKASERLGREIIAAILRKPALFKALLHLGQIFRWMMPGAIKQKIPVTADTPIIEWPKPRHPRKMIVLAGCAQGAMAPSTNAAAASVLDKLGISLVEISGAGCCGAVDLHTTSEDKARAVAKKLIDQWLPHLDEGVEAIVMTASGCGVTIKDYPHLFRHDPEYCEKATSIAGVTRDLSEILDNEIGDSYTVSKPGSRVAFHSPCTLQHGQKLTGKVEGILRRVGYEIAPISDGHMCCGSAGTYSLLQPEISTQLRDNKLQALNAGKPDVVCTANIGCQAHLSVQGQPPVRHWIELLL